MKYGLVIDLLKCMGCHACVVACRAEKGTPTGVLYNRVEQMEVGCFPHATTVSAPMACRHCEDPDCVKACPTGASYKREDGLVLIDPDKCIGCQACIPACPYGARTFVREIKPYYPGQELTPFEQLQAGRHQTGKVEKCDYCAERLAQGKRPACVDTCPALARFFGDLDDPQSEPRRQLALHPAEPGPEGEETQTFYIRRGQTPGL